MSEANCKAMNEVNCKAMNEVNCKAMSEVNGNTMNEVNGEARWIIIGDIHGCWNEFVALLKATGYRRGVDRLVFVGDLVHKGYASQRMLVGVMHAQLTHPNNVFVIRGNHESTELGKWQQWRKGSRKQVHQTFLTDAQGEWLEQHTLPYLQINHQSMTGLENYLVVHGGIYPEYFNQYKKPIPEDLGAVSAKQRERIWRWNWVRYIDESSGQPLAYVADKALQHPGVFWAHTYKGQAGRVVFGHQPFAEPAVYPHAIGIDTGCVHGGHLTAMVLDHIGYQFVSVKANNRYADPLPFDQKILPQGVKR